MAGEYAFVPGGVIEGGRAFVGVHDAHGEFLLSVLTLASADMPEMLLVCERKEGGGVCLIGGCGPERGVELRSARIPWSLIQSLLHGCGKVLLGFFGVV